MRIYSICIFLICFFHSFVFAQVQTNQNELKNKFEQLSSKNFLNQNEIKKLYLNTIYHPVADLNVIHKYDKNEGHEDEIGFCFGRSMAAHLLAKKMNLKDTSIKKIFIMGDLRSDPSFDQAEWRFHVTTIVKGSNNIWYAIDPIMFNGTTDVPLTVKEWIHAVRNGWDTWRKIKYSSDSDPKVKEDFQASLYMVNAENIMPDTRFLSIPEDGSKILDLNFSAFSNGFELNPNKSKMFNLTVGSVNDSKQRVENIYFPKPGNEFDISRFFLVDNASKFDNQFDFKQMIITVKGQDQDPIVIKYHYFNYFTELIDSLIPGSVGSLPEVHTINSMKSTYIRRALKVEPKRRNMVGGMKLPFLKQ